jgi:hypothetical protein
MILLIQVPRRSLKDDIDLSIKSESVTVNVGRVAFLIRHFFRHFRGASLRPLVCFRVRHLSRFAFRLPAPLSVGAPLGK